MPLDVADSGDDPFPNKKISSAVLCSVVWECNELICKQTVCMWCLYVQVEYVEDAQNLVALKLIPRIDYERRRNRALAAEEDDGNRMKRFKRPAQALFVQTKVSDMIQRDGSYTLFEGNRYDSDGFLHKQFRMNAVVSRTVLFFFVRFGKRFLVVISICLIQLIYSIV